MLKFWKVLHDSVDRLLSLRFLQKADKNCENPNNYCDEITEEKLHIRAYMYWSLVLLKNASDEMDVSLVLVTVLLEVKMLHHFQSLQFNFQYKQIMYDTVVKILFLRFYFRDLESVPLKVRPLHLWMDVLFSSVRKDSAENWLRLDPRSWKSSELSFTSS